MKSWGKNSFKLKWFLTITLITLGVYLGFRYLLPLVLPFILAYFFRLDHPSRHRTVVPESEAPQNYRGNLRAAPSGSRIWDGLLHACQYPD